MNSMIMIIDIFITAVPVRWLHFFHAFIYGVIYLIFSVIYWAAGGTDPAGNPFIYPVLDWGGNPGQAAGLSVGLAVIGLPLFHTFVYGLYRLRLVIYKRCLENCGCMQPSKVDSFGGSKQSLQETTDL